VLRFHINYAVGSVTFAFHRGLLAALANQYVIFDGIGNATCPGYVNVVMKYCSGQVIGRKRWNWKNLFAHFDICISSFLLVLAVARTSQ